MIKDTLLTHHTIAFNERSKFPACTGFHSYHSLNMAEFHILMVAKYADTLKRLVSINLYNKALKESYKLPSKLSKKHKRIEDEILSYITSNNLLANTI